MSIAILSIKNTSEPGTNIITVCPNYDAGCQCGDEPPHRVDRYGAQVPEGDERSAEQWARDCAIESLRLVQAEREPAPLTKPQQAAPDLSKLEGLTL